MPDFKKLYFKLFNQVTDTVEDLQNVQCEVEEEIISDGTYRDENRHITINFDPNSGEDKNEHHRHGRHNHKG